MDYLQWTASILLAVTSVGLLVSRDWRFSLGLLAGQYFCAFWLILTSWPLTMSAAKLVTGWMAVAALAMTQIGLPEETQPETSWPQGRLFRLFAASLVLIATVQVTHDVQLWLPNAGPQIVWGALVLIGMGLLHLGITVQPMRVIMGLLTTLAGFEILFATLDTSILVAGLLSAITLGLALTGSYLLTVNTLEEAE